MKYFLAESAKRLFWIFILSYNLRFCLSTITALFHSEYNFKSTTCQNNQRKHWFNFRYCQELAIFLILFAHVLLYILSFPYLRVESTFSVLPMCKTGFNGFSVKVKLATSCLLCLSNVKSYIKAKFEI